MGGSFLSCVELYSRYDTRGRHFDTWHNVLGISQSITPFYASECMRNFIALFLSESHQFRAMTPTAHGGFSTLMVCISCMPQVAFILFFSKSLLDNAKTYIGRDLNQL